MIEHEIMLATTPERQLWFEGPNYTADAVVINLAREEILLIQRSDTGDWALPGGFLNQGESALEAARREAKEETGTSLSTEGVLIYRGIVDDPRNTDSAWIETAAFIFTIHEPLEINAGDDAINVSWVPLTKLPPLYASHKAIVGTALTYCFGARGSGV